MNEIEMEYIPHRGLPNVSLRIQINTELYYLVVYYITITFHKEVIASWSF